MAKIVNGKMLRVGDRVRVINATMGAFGANNRIGTVVDSAPCEKKVSGLYKNDDTLLIKLDIPVGGSIHTYWRVGMSGKYELLETAKRTKKHLDIDVVIKGDITKAIIGDKVGIAKCKAEDSFSEAYGVILAVARAYGLSKEKREALVDALYGDAKTIKDYDTFEILDELKNRL